MRPTPTPPDRLARFTLSDRLAPVSRAYGPPGSGRSWLACATASAALRPQGDPDWRDPPGPRVVYVTTPTGHDPAAPRPAHHTDADGSITSRLSRLGVPDEILGDRERFALLVVTSRASLARALADTLAPRPGRPHLLILDDVGAMADLHPILFDLCGAYGSRPGRPCPIGRGLPTDHLPAGPAPVTHPARSSATASHARLVLALARLGHEVLVVESTHRPTAPLRSTYRLPAGAVWPDDAPADAVVTGRSYRVDTVDGGIGLYAEGARHRDDTDGVDSIWPGAPLTTAAVTRPEVRDAVWSARLGGRPDALLLLRPVGPDPGAPGSLLAETLLGARGAAS